MTHHHNTFIDQGADQPVLVLLHGTGGDEKSLVNLGRTVAPGMSYLGIRGNVSEYGSNRYFRRLAEGVFDMEDMAKRSDELAEWIADPSAAWHGRALVGLGYSNGANMVANLLLGGYGLLRGGVMIRPMNPRSPADGLRLEGVKAQVLVGRFDNICPPETGQALAETLKLLGAETELQVIPSDHSLIQEDVTLATSFLAQPFRVTPGH